ncbi:Topoisomerase IV subunit B [Klebsiella pneumoniae]|uniref:DNA topoisomerase (ATP-hydrolyzing) n=1 Tax=Klebsiella pneumoniae TaxID=573 RepID=A0A377U0H1_KLEPN|nr:Topoisomerase IV subunit B [Klebsiella pneumoniae]
MVNALSKRVEVTCVATVRSTASPLKMGEKVEDLHVTGTCGKRNTGTSVHFWPDESFFDSPRFSVSRLTHLLKAKAVLCPGVEIVSATR